MENKLKISENTVVYCETTEDLDKLFNLVSTLNIKWQIEQGASTYLDTKGYCYDLHRGGRAYKKYYVDRDYVVISAQEFIDLHNPLEKSKSLLKQYLTETPKDEIKARIGKITKLELIPSGEGIKESDGKLNYELDFEFIQAMAERMSKNKNKYPPYNWKKPIDVESLKQSLFRHVIEVMKGNYEDDGMELGHVLGVALNAMMIHYQLKHNDKIPENKNNTM